MSTYSSGAVFIPLDPVESKELIDIVERVIAMIDHYGGYEVDDHYFSSLQSEAQTQDEIAERGEAEFAKAYPELVDWAQALLQDCEDEGFGVMKPTAGLYGVEFCSSESFKEEFAARIVQLAIQRYALAPITFFAAYNGLVEDFNSNYGHIYKVSAERIEVVSTIDLIQDHKDALKKTDLLACLNQSGVNDDRLEDFKVLFRSKDWGDTAQAALKLAARNKHVQSFGFLLEEGVPAEDPGLLRMLESRPEMKAMVEARKISDEIREEVEGGRAAKARGRASVARQRV